MKKKALTQIAFESLSIVFAVLLALGLNSYKQAWDLQRESQLLKKNILKECRSNLEKLEVAIQENEDFQLFIDSLLQSDEIRGFHFSYNNELLSSISWNFTKTSRSFQYMDPVFLTEAAEVYENQDYYMQIANQMFEHLGDMIMQVDNIKPRTLTQTGNYYLSNLISASKNLQEDYQNFLDKNKDLEQKSE
ncbi:MAG: hypothetical protein ABJG47_18320 [Ekhidna sp.]